MIIDGIPVTDEEKAKAELYFMDQQVGTEINRRRANSRRLTKHFENKNSAFIIFLFETH